MAASYNLRRRSFALLHAYFIAIAEPRKSRPCGLELYYITYELYLGTLITDILYDTDPQHRFIRGEIYHVQTLLLEKVVT